MISGRHKLAQLHPAFRPAVELLMDWAQQNGVSVSIYSGYRSAHDQARVCAQIAGKGPCAAPGRSAHQYGLAVDLTGGANVNSAEHRWVMECARIIGFGFVANDPVHIEHPAWSGLRKLLK